MNYDTTIIGAGFSSLAAASILAKKGKSIAVVEQHSQAGGRARCFEDNGFMFDMGPSWYWMPDVFEKYFNLFNHTTSDFYQLKRLSPSYRIFYKENIVQDIPANLAELEAMFEQYEKGSARKLNLFLQEAKYKYDTGMNDMVYKPGLSVLEFLTPKTILAAGKLEIFNSFEKHVKKYFKHPFLVQLLCFPVLFLGAKPKEIPALYSLMNYADIQLGTWYPMGGMHEIVKAMQKIAEENGVHFHFNNQVENFEIEHNKIIKIKTNQNVFETKNVVAGCDYHYVESQLLPAHLQSYSASYWDKRTMAPSCLIYYIGVNKKISNLLHHNLFFDTDFDTHAKEIYDTKVFPTAPMFYVCCPSKTDSKVAPQGHENIFVLIPVAAGIKETEEIKQHYLNTIISRIETRVKDTFKENIVYTKGYAYSNFLADYNAYKGNAYGLANTLKQTAVFKPSIRSKKINNLFYTGQLTVPGPGVPPAIISGQIVANLINQTSK